MITKYDVKQFDQELHFEPISDEFKDQMQCFESYQKDLKDFLIQDALKSQEIFVSNTFLVFDKKDFESKNYNLLAYITILTDSIRLDKDLKEEFKQKGIDYKSLPALKIGRLCVDDKHHGKNIGSCLFAWTAKQVAEINKNAACRFITLDAKRHPDIKKDSFHFYRKFDFKVLKNRKEVIETDVFKQKSGTTPMYLDLSFILKQLKIYK